MKNRAAFSKASRITTIVCAIVLICFPASNLWGNPNLSPSANKKIYSKIKRLNHVVKSLLQKGQLDRAERFAKKTKEIAEKHLGPYDPVFAVALVHLGHYHWARKDFSTAVPFYLQSLKIKEKISGPYNPRLIPILKRIAEIYRRQDDLSRLRPLLEWHLRIKEKSLEQKLTIFKKISLMIC